MAENEPQFHIPVVFQISGPGPEQGAMVLHTLLRSWGEAITRAPVVDAHGTPTHPVRSWWFPEAALQHIDGNTHEPRSLHADRPFLDDYEDTPVLDLLTAAFPTAPHPDDYRTAAGELDDDAYGPAFDAFADQALDLAVKVTQLEEILARLEHAEHVRDGLADLLERTPLPPEPQKHDYLVTVAPSYEGEIEGTRYAWQLVSKRDQHDVWCEREAV